MKKLTKNQNTKSNMKKLKNIEPESQAKKVNYKQKIVYHKNKYNS